MFARQIDVGRVARRFGGLRAASLLAWGLILPLGNSYANHHLCGPPGVRPVFDFDVGTAEGVALSLDGDVFVGNVNTGEIWRAPGGNFDQASVFVDLLGYEDPLSFLLGIDVRPDGTLYAAVNALVDPDVHGLWRVDTEGTASRVAAAPTFFVSLMNDIATDPRGNIYVSDSFGGAIWKLARDGTFDVWLTSELLRGGVFPPIGIEFGVNGLAYHDRALYGVITLNGRIVRIPIGQDGSPGSPETVLEDSALIGADGVELDVAGNIYVTNNFANVVQRVRQSNTSPQDEPRIKSVVAEGLSAPASLAISLNQKTIYIANLSTSAAFPQPHAPVLVKAEFKTPIVSRVCAWTW